MNRIQFCNELINQINNILGTNVSIYDINEQGKIIVNSLSIALANYCDTFREYDFYISKILNKETYFDICFEDLGVDILK